jgi:hypothetical protein
MFNSLCCAEMAIMDRFLLMEILHLFSPFTLSAPPSSIRRRWWSKERGNTKSNESLPKGFLGYSSMIGTMSGRQLWNFYRATKVPWFVLCAVAEDRFNLHCGGQATYSTLLPVIGGRATMVLHATTAPSVRSPTLPRRRLMGYEGSGRLLANMHTVLHTFGMK